MAKIKAFRPIRPNPFYADQLVFTRPQAESVSGVYARSGGLKPLKTLLETGARLRPETPEGQEMAYRDIHETLQSLLEKDQLWQGKTAGIYVYEVVHQHYRQTGIWALTALEDYTNGTIRIHELTFADSVRRLKNYRGKTGLEGSPVLLTYEPQDAINAIISAAQFSQPRASLGNRQAQHRLWKIEDNSMQAELIAAFEGVQRVYLADGHHRLESAAQLAGEQKKNGLTAADYISSLYMATDQLRIEAYDRVVIPEKKTNIPELLALLKQDFEISESKANTPVQPHELHHMGMCLENTWYHLQAKAHTYNNKDMIAGFDAAILQEFILEPVFGIADPKTDSRLKCAGGEKALEEIAALFQTHPGAIAFTLCPLSMEELTGAADAGLILPPKSTWIVPKVPYGLLIYKHEI
jgi:uncharacterized protein (DUF1015 family)